MKKQRKSKLIGSKGKKRSFRYIDVSSIFYLTQQNQKLYPSDPSLFSLFIHGYMPNQLLLPAQFMSEEPKQASPEFLMMKAKHPSIKIKSEQAFPICHDLIIVDQELFKTKNVELREKLQQKVEQTQLPLYFDVMLGRFEGKSGQTNVNEELLKAYQHGDKAFWSGLLKDKISLRYYGQGKKKSSALWEVKEIEMLKDLYDVEIIKKNRKIRKQYSSFYKSMLKFLQKFDKTKQSNQVEVKELYEDYKKMETQQSKYNKLNDKPKTQNLQKNEESPKQIPQEEKVVVEEEKVQESKVENKVQQQSKQISSKSKQKEKEKGEQGEKKKKKETVKKDKKVQIQKTNHSLFSFLKKKQLVKEEKQQMKDEGEKNENDKKVETYIKMFQNESTYSIEELKKQFSDKVMREQSQIQCYSNIVLAKSRLEYYNFPIINEKVDFAHPYSSKRQNMYEDSSEEYSEMIAESINEELMEEEDDQSQFQSNSAIVNDSVCEYQSGHSVSSDQQSSQQQIVKPVFNTKMGKWSFNHRQQNNSIKHRYTMICLLEEAVPLPTKETVEENNEITPQMKMEIYKELHGSYSPKDILTKKIAVIIDNKMSMNKISSMLKDISEKSGSQRVLKDLIFNEFIEEFSQIGKDLGDELDRIKRQRLELKNQEIQAKKEEKQNERDSKLEKLLTEYDRTKTLTQMLQYLKAKDLKMIKNDLSSFIKSKEGEYWDNFREEMKANKLQKKRSKKQKKKKPQQIEPVKEYQPIEEIFKKTQLQLQSKPKKAKKRLMFRKKSQEELYDVDNEKEKKGRKTKRVKKQKVVLNDPLVPQRRNPRRNAKKKKQQEQQMEEVQEIQEQEQVGNNEQMEEVEQIEQEQVQQQCQRMEQQVKDRQEQGIQQQVDQLQQNDKNLQISPNNEQDNKIVDVKTANKSKQVEMLDSK